MMHSTIPLTLGRDFTVAASPAEAHALLADVTALRVWWEPLADAQASADTNAQVSGHWQLRAVPGGTHIHLSLQTQFTLPVPHLLAQAAGHVLALELGRQVDSYVANLTRTLGRL